MKYKAVYEFVARSVDELSLQPGDVVMVSVDVKAEPGWLSGKCRGRNLKHTTFHIRFYIIYSRNNCFLLCMCIIGKSGWFPESYVEKATTPGEGGLMEQGGMAEAVESKTVLEGKLFVLCCRK